MRLQLDYRHALALFLLLTLLLSSCAASQPMQAPIDHSINCTDALGRELTLTRKPRRVAALLGSFADVWVLAGGTPIAAPADAWEDFDLDLGDAVNLGGAHSPSVEALIAADPDLVLASASTASNVQMLETLEAAGIAVIYFDVDCFEDYLDMLYLCTQLTERQDLYEQNGLQIQRRIKEIKAQYANAVTNEQERRVLLLRASSTTVKAKNSRGTVLGEMLNDIGCQNIADRDAGLLEELSMEAILEANPYHILVVTMGDDPTAAAKALQQFMEENPAWETLDAVQNGRVHVMDRTLFNLKPNARWGIAYETLYQTLIGR